MVLITLDSNFVFVSILDRSQLLRYFSGATLNEAYEGLSPVEHGQGVILRADHCDHCQRGIKRHKDASPRSNSPRGRSRSHHETVYTQIHHLIASGLNVNIFILDTTPYSARSTVDPVTAAKRTPDYMR